MSQDLTDNILRYLTQAPTSEFRQAQVAVIDQWEGEENLLWRVRMSRPDTTSAGATPLDAVVKLFLDAGQARSRRQFDGMHFAAARGLCLQPIWVDRYPEGLARQILVYPWAEGEAVDPTDPAALDALATSVATLHSADVETIRRFSPRPLNLDYYWRIEQGSISQILAWLPQDLAIVAAYRQLADAAAQLVEAALPHVGQTPPAPVHGDLRLAHALLHRGQAMLLDWELFGLGDPALDCARFLQVEAQTLTPAQQMAWRDAYLAQSAHPAMGLRLGLYERLLAFDAVTYLLVGLEQHVQITPAQELADALPFLHQTLAAAWLSAADKLALALDQPPEHFLQPFFAWLNPPTAPDAT